MHGQSCLCGFPACGAHLEGPFLHASSTREEERVRRAGEEALRAV